jgi:ABC-type transport system involved in Fe-S cluster assembly fused permease/ATPase subunit
MLNVLQQFIIGVTMCAAMVLAARGVLHGDMTIGGQ